METLKEDRTWNKNTYAISKLYNIKKISIDSIMWMHQLFYKDRKQK